MIEAIAVFFLAVVGAFFLGGRTAKKKAELKDAKDYQKTMERMNEDPAIVGADDARKWLRERKP